MTDMVSVPAEKIAALREVTTTWRRSPETATSLVWDVLNAARAVVDAVVDAVETEDEPRKCYACGSTLEADEYGNLEWCPKCEPTESGPSPARDDAERTKAAREALSFAAYMFATHHPLNLPKSTQEFMDWLNAFKDEHYPHAAHMAAPDELTALREERDFWKDNDNKRSAKVRKLVAERDALRERIRKLADKYQKDADESDNYGGELWSTTATAIRDLLGDA